MAESMSVEAILSAVDENFTKTMESAVDSLSKVMQANQQASGGMIRSGAMMGAAAAVTGKAIGVIKDSLGGAISRFDTLNKYPVVMNALGYSTRDVAKSSQILQKGIDGLPTSLDEITGIAQQLGPLTGGANKAAKSAIALNNAFLASGASVADTSRGLQQYTQMLSTGKVDLMSYRTLMETMPIALRKVANSFGFTGKSAEQDLYSALQSGQITVDQLNDRFIKLNGGVNGFASLARKNSQGIATSFANLKNAVVKNMANMLTAINQGFQQAGFGSIAQVLDNMKVAINASFAAIAPIVTNATKVILVGLKSLVGFANQNRSWLEPLALGIVAFVGQIKAINTAIAIFNRLKTAFEVFKTINQASNVATAVEGLNDLAKSSKLAAAAQTALNIAQSLSPMTWLIVGIVAVVAALTFFFAKTKTGQQLWKNFVGWLSGVWQSLKGVATNVWTGIANAVNSAVDFIKPYWQGLITFFAGIWNAIVSGVIPIWNGIVNVVSSVVNLIVALWQTLAPIIVPIVLTLVTVIGTAFILVVGVVKTAWYLLVTETQIIWSLITTAVTTAISLLGTAISTSLSVIVAIWTTIWNVFSTIVSTVWNVISIAISTALNVIAGIIQLVTALITGNWSGAWNAIKNIVSSVLNGIHGIVSTVLYGVVGIFTSIMNGLKSIVSSVWNAIKNVFRIGVNFIKSVINVDLSGAGRAIMNSLLRGMKEIWENIKSFVGKIAGWIKRHKGPISYDRKLLIPAGQAIMQGLNAGLTDGFGAVQDNVSTMAGRIQSLVANTQNGYAAGLSNLNSSMTSTIAGTMTIENNAQQNRIAQLLEVIANKDTTMVMDSGALVGATAGAYDRNLGQNVALNGRWS